jgi:hypothetical protein
MGKVDKVSVDTVLINEVIPVSDKSTLKIYPT